ncbi:MAG: hypothetical protein J6S69_09215 [Proteobacteria bacterium]|nr:hypothetical protein [Pseudomonadota bacterium]
MMINCAGLCALAHAPVLLRYAGFAVIRFAVWISASLCRLRRHTLRRLDIGFAMPASPLYASPF